MTTSKPYSATCVVCGQTRALATPPQSDTCGRCSSRRNGARGHHPKRRAPKRTPKPVVSFEAEVTIENARWLLSMGESVEHVAGRVGLPVAAVRDLAAGEVCSVGGCGRASKARGWCGVHYDQWRRTTPMPDRDIEVTTND